MNGPRLVLAMCVAEVLGMLGVATFSALLPTFLVEWQLSNTDAGWLSAIFYAGYVAGVPVLVSLTDRLDPRRIYLVSTAISGLAALGFALFATGFWSALAFRVLAGIGLAGTYMPGLKILSDRLAEGAQSRAVAVYTASFGIGISLSFLISGEAAVWLDWRWAFAVAALGSVAAFALALGAVAPAPIHPDDAPDTHLLDFRPVFANRRALAYMLAYAAHNWELFGLRSWIVAFLVFNQALQPAGSPVFRATLVAALMSLASWPASVLGNELAARFGRARVVIGIMLASALIASGIGFAAPFSALFVVALCFVYAATVSGDSGSITAGAVAAAERNLRGATMAVHSFLGFTGAVIGPLVFGIVLDLAGGGASVVAWGLAFAAMGAGVALGPLAIALLGRKGRHGGA